MKTSLGLLEVSGLALAIGAADAMAKAASVKLIGIEKTNGSGWMLIRLTGDVASVQAAISTGAAFAEQHHGLVSRAVLARPATALMTYWLAPTVAVAAVAVAAVEVAAAEVTAVEPAVETRSVAEETEEADTQQPADIASDDAPKQAISAAEPAVSTDESEAQPAPRVSCNLCLDPACRRHKGEPRFRCIHLGKRGKV
ncbi:BMC domain-containing protein [Yersinia alsatica]|uniref:BMC domain-containing protein n=1 Tax=Yersinia alsatica TaxID=2890317 RepID=A0ABY5ULM9_9GAMM|nr:BMC domain-containing protein [Yersinia alsatica]OWF67435.1 propanediol utilization protein [Yersinia frederiksenii]UWM44381.1 BMC domain-containing protein [Yersinia alsatica]CNK85681.1 putative propanediol utilization polyhedral bodies protein [Yersinia frederiksenii]CNK90790.1 putative propanediol utilization polyhedral bodies protein [Yersinia frederiksenii]